MPTTSMLWRRLDTPGHDACRLTRMDAGWQLDGAAVFLHDRTPAQLAYLVACDDAWRTQRGEVRGWIGAHAIDWRITGDDGAWSVNGEPIGGLDDCIDLDFGFTPATNLLQIRRVMLPQGVAVELPVAWLDPFAGTLDRLPQRYERRGAQSLWDEAPRFDYKALLEVNADGFISRYPGLWEAVAG